MRFGDLAILTLVIILLRLGSRHATYTESTPPVPRTRANRRRLSSAILRWLLAVLGSTLILLATLTGGLVAFQTEQALALAERGNAALSKELETSRRAVTDAVTGERLAFMQLTSYPTDFVANQEVLARVLSSYGSSREFEALQLMSAAGMNISDPNVQESVHLSKVRFAQGDSEAFDATFTDLQGVSGEFRWSPGVRI